MCRVRVLARAARRRITRPPHRRTCACAAQRVKRRARVLARAGTKKDYQTSSLVHVHLHPRSTVVRTLSASAGAGRRAEGLQELLAQCGLGQCGLGQRAGGAGDQCAVRHLRARGGQRGRGAPRRNRGASPVGSVLHSEARPYLMLPISRLWHLSLLFQQLHCSVFTFLYWHVWMR